MDLYGTYPCRVVQHELKECGTSFLHWIVYEIQLIVLEFNCQLSVFSNGGEGSMSEWYAYKNDDYLSKFHKDHVSSRDVDISFFSYRYFDNLYRYHIDIVFFF